MSERSNIPHVLQIVADGAAGGGTTAVIGLCKDLVGAGFKVTLVTQPGSYAMSTAASHGIEVIGLDLLSSRFDLSAPKALLRLVRQVRPDVIHAHGGRAAHYVTQIGAKQLEAPIIYTVHGYHFQKKKWPMNLVGRYAELKISKKVDHIAFVSNADRDIGLSIHSGSAKCSSVIYNGIDPEEIAPFAAPEKIFDLAFLGRMHHQKNPLFVIDIMKALRAERRSLLMIGGGELEASVKAAAAEQGVSNLITFTGALGREEALRALTSAKIYLFPSLWEGLPIAPIEAMYLKLPVIGSDIAGTREVVQQGRNGILIDRFDAIEYAESINQLLNDAPRMKIMADTGREIVLEVFTRSQNSEAYGRLYKDLTRRRPN